MAPDHNMRVSRFDIADRVGHGFYLPGGDRDDVQQEARIAVLEAERAFRPERGNLDAFTVFVVRRRLRDALRAATRPGQMLLTDARRTHVDEAYEPDLADRIDLADGLRRIVVAFGRLTPLERRALIAAVNGVPYRHDKQLDNAVTRARRKLRVAFGECAAAGEGPDGARSPDASWGAA